MFLFYFQDTGKAPTIVGGKSVKLDPAGPQEGVKTRVGEGGPLPAPVAGEVSVKELDFSKPPPSLHSNYR